MIAATTTGQAKCDLCDAVCSLTSTTAAGARRKAAAQGWTRGEVGVDSTTVDLCPTCSAEVQL